MAALGKGVGLRENSVLSEGGEHRAERRSKKQR